MNENCISCFAKRKIPTEFNANRLSKSFTFRFYELNILNRNVKSMLKVSVFKKIEVIYSED